MQLLNLLTFTGVMSFAFSGVQAASGFSNSCKNIRIDDNTILRASCQKTDGTWADSELGLNQCLVNVYGQGGPDIQCQKLSVSFQLDCVLAGILTSTYMCILVETMASRAPDATIGAMVTYCASAVATPVRELLMAILIHVLAIAMENLFATSKIDAGFEEHQL
ncbi:hypothetical protein CTheo_6781 [Ceratobasidium theobromae]|uniref:Cyanovirin-N domain-containing protein n=1 Tax=Ceratobasidium theobromae TaxID=1582974 RepID=A0A5N5QDN9_9AGAM|nr:hypothetical protein CTheo_6781 [Ceratobasidium theobromae]